jgi:hypothetical protein
MIADAVSSAIRDQYSAEALSDYVSMGPATSSGAQKPITDARLGQNEPRALRIGFDLSPQLSDVNPKVLRVDQFVPKLTAQNFLRHHLTGVLH